MQQALSFVKEAREEFGKVSWPKREDTLRLTFLVIAISLIFGAYVGGLDFVFTNLFNFLLGR